MLDRQNRCQDDPHFSMDFSSTRKRAWSKCNSAFRIWQRNISVYKFFVVIWHIS
jgi:hypothetical protein